MSRIKEQSKTTADSNSALSQGNTVPKNNFLLTILWLALLALVISFIPSVFFPSTNHSNNRDYTIESSFDVADPQWRENGIVASQDNSYARERTILNTHGGEDVTLILLDHPCGVQYKYLINACVLPSDSAEVMYISPEIKNSPALETSALIVHELGHIYQKRISADFLATNPVVIALFPGEKFPEEALADCMAEAITGITTGAYIDECSVAQLRVAQQVWDGIVPTEEK